MTPLQFHSDTEPLIPGSMLTDERVTMPRIMARNIKAHAMEYTPEEVCGLIGGESDTGWMLLARTPNHSPDNLHNYRIRAYSPSCRRGSVRRAQSTGAGCVSLARG